MQYQINFEQYKHSFSLPACIVADDFKDIHSDYLKIILLIFKNPDKEYSVNLLTNLLNLSESTVQQALSFWTEKGVLKSCNQPEIVVHHVSRPKHPTEQRETNDAELKFLLEQMQSMLGRTATSTDLRNITYIYEYYRLPADVILMAIQYAVELGKTSIRYIETICISWYEQGIITHTLAEEHLKRAAESRQQIQQVKQIFGISGRSLIASEEKMILTWLSEYKADLAMIELAFERTIKNTGKVAFAYTNKILQSWHKKGYHSMEEIQSNEPGSTRQSPKKESSLDIDLLDRLMDKVPNIHD